jgi:Spy/CpxP family protein refolding chaperone
MSMTTRTSRLALAAGVAAAALALAAPAPAQMPEMPPGKWWKRPAVVQKLGITADQQNQLEEIFSKNRRTFIDLKADVERRQLDVEELMAKKDSDPKKVSAAFDASEQAKARLRKSISMMVLEMRGVLTEAQWKQVMDRREEWRQERNQELRDRLREGRPRRRGPDGPGGPPDAPPPAPREAPKE